MIDDLIVNKQLTSYFRFHWLPLCVAHANYIFSSGGWSCRDFMVFQMPY
jgi:hypothetical protein